METIRSANQAILFKYTTLHCIFYVYCSPASCSASRHKNLTRDSLRYWKLKTQTYTNRQSSSNRLPQGNLDVLPVLTSHALIRPLLWPVIMTTSWVPIRRYLTDVDARRFTSGVVMQQNSIEWTNDPTLTVSMSSFNMPQPSRTELRTTSVSLARKWINLSIHVQRQSRAQTSKTC